MKKFFTVFFLALAAAHGAAESVYTYDVRKDLVIGSLSLGLAISPFFVHNKPDRIPVSLEQSDVTVFDRSFMFSYKKPLDFFSDYSVYGLMALPVISAIRNLNDKNKLLTYGIMDVEAFLLTFGTVSLLKSAVIRYRPYMYSYGIPGGKEQDYYNSFPSGAAAYAFLGATFLSTSFSREYPESKWKLPVLISSYAFAAGIASMRVIAGSHFVSDVLVGAAIGSLYGWLIPVLHIKNNNKKHTLLINFTGNGLLATVGLSEN
jgi:membrane-associated phospholipid phosphatase